MVCRDRPLAGLRRRRHLDAARDLLSGPAKETDIVLLDIRLETEWGLDLIPWLKSHAQKGASVPAVAVYSCFSDSAHVNAALALGVKAYIIKKRDETELEAALETVLSGGEWIDSEAERPPKAASGPLATLTRREAQILSLIKAGLSFREIARRLGIKLHTVQNTARVSSSSRASASSLVIYAILASIQPVKLYNHALTGLHRMENLNVGAVDDVVHHFNIAR